MGRPTGQMKKRHKKLLDEYNELYNWEYNDMCDFIENYGETEFLTTMKHTTDLLKIMVQKLVDDFANILMLIQYQHFEEMYQGQYDETFAEMIASDLDMYQENIGLRLWEKLGIALSYDYID